VQQGAVKDLVKGDNPQQGPPAIAIVPELSARQSPYWGQYLLPPTMKPQFETNAVSRPSREIPPRKHTSTRSDAAVLQGRHFKESRAPLQSLTAQVSPCNPKKPTLRGNLRPPSAYSKTSGGASIARHQSRPSQTAEWDTAVWASPTFR